MKVYEKIQEMDEETMIEFLFTFAKEVIEHFASFQMPDREPIRALLEKEID